MYFGDISILYSCAITVVLSYLFSKYQCGKNLTRNIVFGIFVILILLVYKLLDCNEIWLVSHLLALGFGLYAYRLSPLIFSVALIFPFSGISFLSNQSDPDTMFFGFIILMALAYYLLHIKTISKLTLFICVLTSSLWAYYFIGLIMAPMLWINGLLVGILALIIGTLFRYRDIGVVYMIIPLFGFAYFSYYVYPDFKIQIEKEKLLVHSLDNFSFRARDSTILSQMRSADLVLIETWHQYCASCFACMEDQHQAFQQLEVKYDFHHYYAFVGKGISDEEVYNFEGLPFRDQKVIIDKDQEYYSNIQMLGAPYLNFYKNGEYQFSIGGYESRYAVRFKEYMEREIEKLSKLD